MFYRGPGAAARAYLESDHSHADEYYLESGDAVAQWTALDSTGSVRAESQLDGETYQAWVDWRDPATGEPLPPGTRRLPGNVHITVPGRTADALLFSFDMAGLDTSSGSACTAGVAEPSHVVAALPGRTESDARATQRFTLGRTTTPAEAAALIDALRTLLGPGV